MCIKEQRKNSKEKRGNEIKSWIFFLCCFFYSLSSIAQCAMCRAALESEDNGVKAEAVNDGIVYLMAIPYVLVGILGYAIFKMRYRKKK